MDHFVRGAFTSTSFMNKIPEIHKSQVIKTLIITKYINKSDEDIASFAFVIIILNSKETLWTPCTTQHNSPDDGILHSHRRENLKCYFLVGAFPRLGCNKMPSLLFFPCPATLAATESC
jgi:hypothetical protein